MSPIIGTEPWPYAYRSCIRQIKFMRCKQSRREMSSSDFDEHFFEMWLWANEKWPYAPTRAQFEAELSMYELVWGKTGGFPGARSPLLVPLRAMQEFVRKFVNNVPVGRTTSCKRRSRRVAQSVAATFVSRDGYAHLRAEEVIRKEFQGSSKATVDDLVRIWDLVQAELGVIEGPIFSALSRSTPNDGQGSVPEQDIAKGQSCQNLSSSEPQAEVVNGEEGSVYSAEETAIHNVG